MTATASRPPGWRRRAAVAAAVLILAALAGGLALFAATARLLDLNTLPLLRGEFHWTVDVEP